MSPKTILSISKKKKKMGRLLNDLFLDFNISLLFSKFSKTLKKKAKVRFVSTFLYKFTMQSQEKTKFSNIFA